MGLASGSAERRMWMAAGEGLETMLSLRIVLPAMPMVAALSSAHLAALILPAGLRRLYIARDNDQAGHRAAEALGIRANAEGIEDLVLTPYADDFNTDLCGLGSEALAAALRVQLAPEDVGRFLIVDQLPGPRPRQRARRCRVRPRRRPRPAFRIAMVPEAAEPRNGCARLSSPGGTPARLAPLGLPPSSVPSLGHLIAETVSSLASGRQWPRA